MASESQVRLESVIPLTDSKYSSDQDTLLHKTVIQWASFRITEMFIT